MRPSSALLPVLLACAAYLPAQGNGVTLLSRVDSYSSYAGIWGYTAPDGREYALIGTSTGTAIYNCTNPTAPYLTAFISGPSSGWREVRTWDRYAYVVTEGGGGVQIVSLVDPDRPALVKTWGTSLWGNAHTISMDMDEGMAYVNGTNAGMRVLDLADPVNPVLVATYTSRYVHDCHVQHGRGNLAEIYDGRFRIVSVTSLPSFPTLDSVVTPGAFTHNVWANAIDSLAVTTDENSGGKIALYDITDPYDIRFISGWTNNANSTVHNAYIRGNWVFASWYTQGFVCVDVSDPANPQFVGSYDTTSSTGKGYNGAWGCYPFTPSRTVYVSDMANGLYVLRVDNTARNAILLAGSTTGSVGGVVSYSLYGAPGNAPYWLYYSLNRNGTTINGHSFDIGTPYFVATTGLTDLEGSATWTSGPLPSRAAGRTLYVEARADAGGLTLDSNFVALTIQ